MIIKTSILTITSRAPPSINSTTIIGISIIIKI